MTLDRRHALKGLIALPMLGLALSARAEAPTTGRLVEHSQMTSAHVGPRDVTVWLPPGYDATDAGWPVLYMHDGQNLFDSARAGYGVEWGVDEHVSRLGSGGQIRMPIVVGVHNTPLRLREYVPADMIRALPADIRTDLLTLYGGDPLSDGYLRFLVEELKPFIDRTYRTRPARGDTVIMGSSMGGLISLYALMKHPEVFGSAGCLSTHWPLRIERLDDNRLERWRETVVRTWSEVIARGLPDPAAHRLYFDRGDETLDQFYAFFQSRIDTVVTATGWGPERFRSLVFPGAEHNEASWNQRLDTPLTFLLPPE